MSDFSAALQRAKAIAAKLSVPASNKRPYNDEEPPSSGYRAARDPSQFAPSPFNNNPNSYQPHQHHYPQQSQPLSHYAPTEDKSEIQFMIPANKVGLVIGKGGETMKKIQNDYGCRIQFSPDDIGVQRQVTVSGANESNLKQAQVQIEIIAIGGRTGFNELSYSGHGLINYEYQCPNNKVGLVIGKGGETIVTLQQKSGAKAVVTPDGLTDKNLPTRVINLTGTTEQINAAKLLIDEIVGQTAGLPIAGTPGAHSEQIFVQDNKVGLVIGKGGEGIKGIMRDCNCRIIIEQEPGPMGRSITLTGNPLDIEQAKYMIDERLGPGNQHTSASQPYGAGPQDPYANPYGAGYGADPYAGGYVAGVDPYAATGADPYAAQGYGQQQYDPYYQQQQPTGAEGYGYDPSYYQQPYGAAAPPPPPGTNATTDPAAPGATGAAEGGDPNAADYQQYYDVNDPNYAAWYAYYYGNPGEEGSAPAGGEAAVGGTQPPAIEKEVEEKPPGEDE